MKQDAISFEEIREFIDTLISCVPYDSSMQYHNLVEYRKVVERIDALGDVVVVPRVPTDAMFKAGTNITGENGLTYCVYTAMIAAAGGAHE